MKAFYARIKAATRDDLVARLFMPGLAEVSLDSGLTGFNIARDISQTPVFVTMAGFTETELRAAIHQTIAASLTDENRLSNSVTLTALFRLGFLTRHPTAETKLVCPGKAVEAIFQQYAANEFKAADAQP